MNPHLQMSSSLPPFSCQEHAKQHHCLPLILLRLLASHKKQNPESFVLRSSNSYMLWSKDTWLSEMHARFNIFQEELYYRFTSRQQSIPPILPLKSCKSQHSCTTRITRERTNLQPPYDASHCPSK